LAKLPENRFASTTELIAVLDACSKGKSPAPADPTQPSLDSVRAMATPVARRVRRSVLSGIKNLEGTARRTLADSKPLLGYATRWLVALRGTALEGRELLEGTVRRILADPKAVLAYAARRRLMIVSVLAASAGTIIIAMAVRAGTHPTPALAPEHALGDTAPSVASANPFTPGTLPRSGVQGAPSVATADDLARAPSQPVLLPPTHAHESKLVPTLQSAPSAAAPANTPSAARPPSSSLPPSPSPSTSPDPCKPPYRLDFFGNKVLKPGCS
jgi:hypothetical protein